MGRMRKNGIILNISAPNWLSKLAAISDLNDAAMSSPFFYNLLSLGWFLHEAHHIKVKTKTQK